MTGIKNRPHTQAAQNPEQPIQEERKSETIAYAPATSLSSCNVKNIFIFSPTAKTCLQNGP
jgi:hypothetical protein